MEKAQAPTSNPAPSPAPQTQIVVTRQSLAETARRIGIVIPSWWGRIAKQLSLPFLLILVLLPGVIAQPPRNVFLVVQGWTGEEIAHGQGSLIHQGAAWYVDVPYHLIRGAKRVRVALNDSEPTEAVGVYSYSVKADRATLAIQPGKGHPISFADMCRQTQIRGTVLEGLHIIGPSHARTITWKQDDDALLMGTLEIGNGSGDIQLRLAADSPTNTLWNPGFVSGIVQVARPLRAGRSYWLTLDNGHSMLTLKNVQARLYSIRFR